MSTLFLDDAEIVEIRRKVDTLPWARELFSLVRRSAARTEINEDHGNPIWFWSRVARDKALVYAISRDERELPGLRDLLQRVFRTDRPDIPLADAVTEWHVGHRRKPGRGTGLFDADDWVFGARCGGYFWAYDLVKEHPLFRGAFGDRLESRFAELLDIQYKALTQVSRWSNTRFWYTAGVGILGYLLENRDAVKLAVDGPYGFKAALDHLDDGCFWPEATFYGLHYVTCTMTILAELARHNNGEDLYHYVAPSGGSLKAMYDAFLGLLLADGRLASHGDCGTQSDVVSAIETRGNHDMHDWWLYHNRSYREANKYEIAYRIYRDPRYAWLLAQDPGRRSWDFTFWGYAGLTHGVPLGQIEPPSAISRVFPQYGSAILRADETPTYWHSAASAVHVRNGCLQGYHTHRDQFGLALYAFGRPIYPDWFIQWDYIIPRIDEQTGAIVSKTPYSKNSIAHNTISVDGQDADKTDITFSQVERRGGMQFITVEGSAYEGVHAKRVLGLTGEYLLDVFSLDSAVRHTYDYHLHSFGSVTLEGIADLQPYNSLDTGYGLAKIDERSSAPDNRWIRPGESGTTSADWSAIFSGEDGIGCHAVMLGGETTQVITGNTPYYVSHLGWDDPPIDGVRRDMPLLLARRKARATTFIVVHQPFKGTPSPLSIHRDGNTLFVEGATFTDRITLSSWHYERLTGARRTNLSRRAKSG